jgi:hypothetical membrane protein
MGTRGRGVPGDAILTARKRIMTFAVTVVAAAGLLIIGIFHEEMGEVLFNACMLRLSCIGIG